MSEPGPVQVTTWISPEHRRSDFPAVMSIDDKITVFAARVRGWQLDIAQYCADNVEHSGFAVLHILSSYFEMVAKFRDGFMQGGGSRKYFKEGVFWVFPELRTPAQMASTLLGRLYEEVRCGLYHSGMTGRNVWVSDDWDAAIAFNTDNHAVVINPHLLVGALERHFESYLQELREPENHELRASFEKRYDHLGT